MSSVSLVRKPPSELKLESVFLMANFKSGFSVSGFITLLITSTIGYSNGEYEHLLNNGNGLCVGSNCADRAGNGVAGGMWFGPRLGRRRRSGGISAANDNDMDSVVNPVNSGTWSFIPYHGVDEKRHSTQFTPRLGRELVDEFLERIIAANNNDHISHLVNSKSSDIDFHRQLIQPSSLTLFQPRLGRQQIYLPPSRLDH